MRKLILSIILCMFTMVAMTSLSFASDVNSKDANAQKATAVLESLGTGDKTAITKWISKDQYVQHDLAFPKGREILLGVMDQLKAAGTKVDIKRVIVDGEYVVLHTDYNFFGPKAGFDIFRFENGKIVEHWDSLQEKIEKNPSGHSMFDGATEIKDLDKTAANKALVKDFVETILKNGQLDKIGNYFDGDNYIQHNPGIGDGLSGLGSALNEMAKQGIIMKYDKLHMVLGQGNFVLAVSEGTFGGKHTSYYDLFRVENGKIAEHWDVMENILPYEQWKNQNGKYSKNDADIATISSIINKYAQSIDLADTQPQLASEIWATTDNVSFIHPRGHEHGWEAIKNNFYGKTMGETFSERKLNIHDGTIHVYGDSAVAEFYWDFSAKLRSDGTPLNTKGRESQMYIKGNQGWKLVHVHYSNMPVTGERQGF